MAKIEWKKESYLHIKLYLHVKYTNFRSNYKSDFIQHNISLRRIYFHQTPLIRALIITGLLWGRRWPIMPLSTWACITVKPAFSSIHSSLAPPWLTVPSSDKQDKEGFNILLRLNCWIIRLQTYPLALDLGQIVRLQTYSYSGALNCTVLFTIVNFNWFTLQYFVLV